MSHTNDSPQKPTRRTVLAGTTAAIAASGLVFGMPGSAVASLEAGSAPVVDVANGSQDLCMAHHKELSDHLKSVLNSAYVDENMKNKMLSTSHCPHCKTAIAPDMLDQSAFSILA